MSAGRVAVLRHQLYRPSEPFIPGQALALKTFSPVMVARDAITNAVEGLEARVFSRGRLDRAAYSALMDVKSLVRELRAIEPVILHAHFGVEGVYAQRAARILSLPLVVTLHGFDVSLTSRALWESGRLGWMQYALRRSQLLGSRAAFICVSEHVRRRATALGLRSEQVAVIPTGVDTNALRASVLPDNQRIVHVGRLVEKKGTANLIKAFALVAEALPDAELVIVGEGPLRASLETLANQLHVSRRVQFLGALPHEEALHLVRQSRVLAAPSVTSRAGDQEGLPQVVLEAGALGRPVVGTNHSGIPEAVLDEKTGLLVEEGDEPGLADKLRIVLEDGGVARKLGLAARARVETQYDVGSQAVKVEDLYRSTLELG